MREEATVTAVPSDAGAHRMPGNHGVAVRLEGVDKVYRTEKVETVALSAINLDIAACTRKTGISNPPVMIAGIHRWRYFRQYRIR